jgi:amino acid transporter
MPVPWLTVLQSVPWSDVLKNAPKVADGARKLWSSVGKKPQSTSPEVAVPAAASPGVQTIAALESRIGGIEAALTDLQAQMLASSELIKALADQNAQLIQRIESNRVRWLWLAAAVACVGAVALTALAWLWIGRPTHV